MANLLDREYLKRYWEDGHYGQHKPCWGPPQLKLVAAHSESDVADAVNRVLADQTSHVLAVSPAAVGVTSPDGYAWYVVTVLYQERLEPTG